MLIHRFEDFEMHQYTKKKWPPLLGEFGKSVSMVEEGVHNGVSSIMQLCMCWSEFLLILEWQPDWSLIVFEHCLSTGHTTCLQAAWYKNMLSPLKRFILIHRGFLKLHF